MAVLIVDDEVDTVEELVELLQFRGLAVYGATRPEDALRMVLDDPEIDSVVIDVRMPGMSGVELIRQLQAVLPEARPMRFFVATGHADRSDLGLGEDGISIDGFFTKPLDVKGLIAALTVATSPLWVSR